jgi:hypothetical protein
VQSFLSSRKILTLKGILIIKGDLKNLKDIHPFRHGAIKGRKSKDALE